jgi:hypothetical protein
MSDTKPCPCLISYGENTKILSLYHTAAGKVLNSASSLAMFIWTSYSSDRFQKLANLSVPQIGALNTLPKKTNKITKLFTVQFLSNLSMYKYDAK